MKKFRIFARKSKLKKNIHKVMMLTLFTMLGSLALLMFGMKSMSEALQKMAGPQLRHALGAMTSNRFTGLLTGSVVTASVQSSTATTVMTVSFVNAGLLTLTQAISVIMGPISVPRSRHGSSPWVRRSISVSCLTSDSSWASSSSI